jgi:UDP-N-acetylglucosamine 4,6-dehydratase
MYNTHNMNISNTFKNKVLLITGGTGSFGEAVLSRFLESEIKEVRIFSRDEKKQEDMRIKYKNEKLKFFLGDIRDKSSIDFAMSGVDYLFHAAALKQVPSCEFFPLEAVKTNIIGTENVLQSAIESGVKNAVFLSTDKAVYPINAMGISKALMEKTVIAKSRSLSSNQTIVSLTRYGNVMGSRGSVIPLFREQIDNGLNLTVTNTEMTRFIMSLEDSVDLVLYAFENANQGDIFVQKASACSIGDLAKALLQIKKSKLKIDIIGTRHGEKHYESLIGSEEMTRAIEEDNFYRIVADDRDLNYEKYFTVGNQSKDIVPNEYNSSNTSILNVSEIIAILKETFKDL